MTAEASTERLRKRFEEMRPGFRRRSPKVELPNRRKLGILRQ
jgi:hypothetical protein